jgi:hypothetical protein
MTSHNVQLSCFSPFKGGDGGGMGHISGVCAPKKSHPHPVPPLEGEGNFAWLNLVANQETA